MKAGACCVVALVSLLVIAPAPAKRAGCCESTNSTDPAWLPDGRTIVFEWRTAGVSEIFRLSVDEPGSTRQSIVGYSRDQSAASVFSLSADGRIVAFVGGESSDGQLATIRPDGSGERMLGVPAAGAPLAASPDGAQIAFSPVWEPGSNPQVAVLDVASGAVTSLGAGMAPRWSPDGAAVAFVRARHVWVARPDGSGARQVSTGPGQHFGAAWTPDGRSIAYVSERREGHHPPRIEIVGRDGGGRRVLRDHAISPAFSHDGRLLAFLGVDRAGEATDIRIFELASGKERRLGVLSAGGLAFSPDDSRLAFVSENNNGTGIAVISTGGGGARDLDGACLPPDAPPLLGCSQFGGYSVPFAGATAPFELIVRNQGAQPSEPVRLQITVRDSNGYRVRGARVRLEIVPAAAAAVPVATGTTYFDGYRPFEIALRTRRLARVRFIVSVLGGRNVVARHVYTCRGLHLPPVRGCR